MQLLKFACAGIPALVLSASIVSAQENADGRFGPVEFNGHALDRSLQDLNAFLQARYQHDDMMMALMEPPAQDFRETAVASAMAPDTLTTQTIGGFDDAISGDASLNVHLVAFNDQLAERNEPLFVRIANAASDTSIDMTDVAAIAATTDDRMGFGSEISDDLTLDDNMAMLSENILEKQDKDLKMLDGEDAVTGVSFQRYGEALKLF